MMPGVLLTTQGPIAIPTSTPSPAKVATKAEMDAAVSAAFQQGWNEALDAVAEALPGVRLTLESFGWTRERQRS